MVFHSQEINHRNATGVDRGKHNEILIPDVRECDRRYLNDQEIEQPAHCGADPTNRRTKVDGRNLGSVEEWHAQEAKCVDEVVEVDEEDARFETASVVWLRAKASEGDLGE